MMIIARSMGYEDILNAVKGKRVVVWTCGTCARLCYGIGGTEAAARLAEELNKDGVNASAVHVSAACLTAKVKVKADGLKEADAVVSLTCAVGDACLRNMFRGEIITPLITLGHGYADADGSFIVTSGDGVTMSVTAEKAARDRNAHLAPIV